MSFVFSSSERAPTSDADNPKNYIKEPVKRKYGEFNDGKAIKYYTELAKKYGGEIKATFLYGHALVRVDNNERKNLRIMAGESKREIRIVDRVNKPETVPGYFLAAVSECEVNGKWIFYNELTDKQSIEADKDLKESILYLLKKMGVDI
jgi:hypothetical protein